MWPTTDMFVCVFDCGCMTLYTYYTPCGITVIAKKEVYKTCRQSVS